MLEAAGLGADLLVVEPVAGSATPWWSEWSDAFRAAGGREDRWRFLPDLPERLRLLDKAAGLDHREMKGKSLWLRGAPGAAAGG
jgi:hypothetical protein